VNPAVNCEPLSERTTHGVPWCFPKVQTGGTFGRDGGMYRNKVHAFIYVVDDVHNCIIAMGLRQFDYEVNTDCVLWCCQCLRGMELTEGSSVLQLRPVT
jgi:hypothetical protein